MSDGTIPDRITVHIRPEELRVSRDQQGQARVESVAYTGEVAEIQIQLEGGETMTAKQLGVSTLTEGEQVRLTAEDGLAVLLTGENKS